MAHIQGIELNKRGVKRDHLAEAKQMAQVAGLCVLPHVKMPRAVRKDKGVLRGPNRQDEACFRDKILIPYLRKICGKRYVKRIENSVTGKYLGNFLPDVVCFHNSFTFWVECKSITGDLSIGQRELKHKIEECGGHYIVAYSLEDVKNGGII